MKLISHMVNKEEEGLPLLSILKNSLGASSSLIKINKERGGNLLNGKDAYTNVRVKQGDTVSLNISDVSTQNDHFQRDESIQILYEDEYLLAIDKPAGVEVHPSPLSAGDTLCDIMKGFFKEGEGFHAVNRLDRGTSGIMIIAKTGYMQSRLIPLLHTEKFSREYLAACEGAPEKTEGVISLKIDRDPSSAIKRRVSESGLQSRTGYKVVLYENGRSLVSLRAYTGRTHQLRVHMSAIGCPLTGDWLYGEENRALIKRPALHSHSIELIHPLTGEKLNLSSPLPDDIKALFASLR